MARSFTEQTRLAVDRMIGASEQEIRGAILQVTRNIIMRTPVGNPSLWQNPSSAPAGYVGGSLRGAWNASIGRPEYVRNRRPDEGGATTISDANNVLSSMQAGGVFYLTNALPYAQRVENGWSRQAPNGMLRRAVIDANRAIGERYGQ